MSSKQLQALWAKKTIINGDFYWLPLLTHLEDTMHTIVYLYNQWLAPAQQKLIQGDLSEDEIIQLITFVGFTHDIGKATPVFQIKKSYMDDKTLDTDLIEKLENVGFEDLANTLLMHPNESKHALAGESLLLNANVNRSISAIIGAHHGKPLQSWPTKNINDYTTNYYQTDQPSSYQTPWKQVQQELIDLALQNSGYQSTTEIPNIDEQQAILISGLLVMADWLASSESMPNKEHTPLFPLITLTQTYQDIDENSRYQTALKHWHQSNELEPQPVDTTSDPYQSRWGFSARPIQKTITDTIQKTTDPGLIILEAPMGIGKTETALLASEQLAYQTDHRGLFFGLPTQATTNAMFTRIKDWLNTIEPNNDISMHLMHNKANFNHDYTDLPHANNINNNSTQTAVVNDWFAGKKSILDEITIGTVDHLLLLALQQKHLMLRHLGLSKKVVIIDEVHAYDAYMSQYLNRALTWLGTYHVPVIMLSATLPIDKRNDFLAFYYQGKFGKKLKIQDSWSTSEAYPLLTILDNDNIQQVDNFPTTTDSKKVTINKLTLDNSALITDIDTKLSNGGIAGLIINTVKRAQELTKIAQENNLPVITLHSSFLAPDRSQLEQEIQTKIGKNAKRPAKLLVIGTQVLEQSLDIDFDILYTDLAPMDLLLQRIGRLHRHQISRLSNLQQPITNILISPEEDHPYGKSNEYIYSKYLLQKTIHYLPKTISLPQDISRLVQLVYNNQTDYSELETAKEDFNLELTKERKKAQAFLLNKPKSKYNLQQWLSNKISQTDTNDLKAQAAVRDIQPKLEILLIKTNNSEYNLINGENINKASSKLIAQQTIPLPYQFSWHLAQNINTLETETLKQFPEWQQDYWLKDQLVLVLDENNQVRFDNYLLTYDQATGLQYTKEEQNRENS